MTLENYSLSTVIKATCIRQKEKELHEETFRNRINVLNVLKFQFLSLRRIKPMLLIPKLYNYIDFSDLREVQPWCREDDKTWLCVVFIRYISHTSTTDPGSSLLSACMLHCALITYYVLTWSRNKSTGLYNTQKCTAQQVYRRTVTYQWYIGSS